MTSVLPPLSYSSVAVSRPIGRRFTICLFVTAALLAVLALLIGWTVFAYFGEDYKWVKSPSTLMTPKMVRRLVRLIHWEALWKAVPVTTILLGFASIYVVLARSAQRGNRMAQTAVTLMALVHTLVAALWVLTIFVFSAQVSDEALTWWEKAIAYLVIFLSLLTVPWMGWVTVQGFDQLRRPIHPMPLSEPEDPLIPPEPPAEQNEELPPTQTT
jgi:hypothetical protein